jgi:hypothetical protein
MSGMMCLHGSQRMDALSDSSEPGLTRRRLVQLGAGASVALYIGGFERLTNAAAATAAPAPLRRSSYTLLAERSFQVTVDGVPQVLNLTAAEDLPVADTVPSLQGLDDAFALHFSGSPDASFAGGTREFVHPQLGRFSLFLAPVEQQTDEQRYEAIIDRTVRIPGINDDGSPKPVDPPRRQEVVIRNDHRIHRHKHHHRHR